MVGAKLSHRYEILREIGRGGMGVVYVARDPLLQRDVAIKVLPPHLLSAEAEERFKREARVVANMDHPAIVAVHDIGEYQGSLFFVMPYVNGKNLRSVLEEGSLSIVDVLNIGVRIAKALEYSHSQGVFHRDIKPENILVIRDKSEEMRVLVTDFGLAVTSTQERLTKAGTLVGTYSYWSPEQLTGGEFDGRSDIYSLGTLLYECLAGRAPFSGEILTVLDQIANEVPASLRSLVAGIDEELDGIVMRCLEKDPGNRPQKAGEVAEALAQCRSKLQKSDKKFTATSDLRKPGRGRFVGREKELAELQRRLHTAMTGECQFVVVGGEPGLGKSRLLDEFQHLATIRNIRVLRSRFVELDHALPYYGFCELIQDSLRSHRTDHLDFSDLAPDLISLFPSLNEIEEIRHGATPDRPGGVRPRKFEDVTHVFELLACSLSRIAAGKPMVILLDDLHAGNLSVEALQYIVRRLGPTPTLIVGTYRTTEVEKRHPLIGMLDSFCGDRRFASLWLGPFSPSEHFDLLMDLTAGVTLPQTLIDRLYEATEGNPYFTVEIVRSFIDSQRGMKTGTSLVRLLEKMEISSDLLPATIRQTVEKRIEKLPKNLRAVLSNASLLGRTFESRDVEMLYGKSEKLGIALEDLARRGFIEEEPGVRGNRMRFVSGLVREVLCAGIPRKKRKSLNRKYAEELEKRNQGRLERLYPVLLHHYTQGDVPSKAVEYGLKLARKSLDATSAEDAIRATRTVLSFLENSTENRRIEAETRSLLAQALRMAGSIDGAIAELDCVVRILEQEKDTTALVHAILLAADTAWEGRKVHETTGWVEKGLRAARAQGETKILFKLLSLGATVANLGAEYERAKLYLEEAEQLRPGSKDQKTEIPRGGKLIVALPGKMNAIHPEQIKFDSEAEILSNVFEPLVSIDEQGNFVPHLCERWDIFDQGKLFHFTVRKNVFKHDGHLLTAHDLKSSCENTLRRSGKSVAAAVFTIRGLQEYLNGLVEHIEGIIALSDDKLAFQLEQPMPTFFAIMAHRRSAIAMETKVEGGQGACLVGTGPFRIASIQPDRVVLERNPRYWKGTSNLDSIEFRPGVAAAEIAAGFGSGRFDLVRDLRPEDLEEILRDRRLRATLIETAKKNTYFIVFNSSGPNCRDPNIRLALCGMIRTHDLVRASLGRFAQPAEGLFPPGILGHDPARRRHPLMEDRVRELLQSSTFSAPLRLKAFVHPVHLDRYGSFIKALFKGWSEMGVEVFVESPETAREIKTEVDLIFARCSSEYDDPDNFTNALFHSQTGRLAKYYSSKELDQRMEEARLEKDMAKRIDLYKEIQDTLLDSGILLPLFHEIDYRVAGPQIRGLTLRNSPPYVNYAELGKTETTVSFATRKSEGGTLHVPIVSQVDSLDPLVVSSVLQGDVVPTIFETLTREVEAAQIVPWLVSGYVAESEGRKFRFSLRENVRFHDGRPLTSRDVRYSLERLLRAGDKRHHRLVAPIRGISEFLSGAGAELSGFRICSTSEFTIELDRPISFFPSLLSVSSLAIVPEGSEHFDRTWRDGTAGTGPFRILRFEPGRKLELEANPYYWRQGYPKSDGLVFHFGVPREEIPAGVRKGRFSLAGGLLHSDVEALRHEPEFASQFRESPHLSTTFIALNSRHGPFSDERLRRRFMHAVDVHEIIRRHLGRLAIPANSLIPPGLLGYEARRPTPARPVTETVNVPSGQLTLVMAPMTEGSYTEWSLEMVDAFRKAGFPIRHITPSKPEYYRALAEGNVDIAGVVKVADYPDSDSFIYGILHSQGGLAGRLCGNQVLDHLIEQARLETNPQIRHSIYREIEEMIAQQALLLPLFHMQAYRFVRTEVEGFEVAFGCSAPLVPYEKLWIRR